jgi:hypothetical protein
LAIEAAIGRNSRGDRENLSRHGVPRNVLRRGPNGEDPKNRSRSEPLCALTGAYTRRSPMRHVDCILVSKHRADPTNASKPSSASNSAHLGAQARGPRSSRRQLPPRGVLRRWLPGGLRRRKRRPGPDGAACALPSNGPLAGGVLRKPRKRSRLPVGDLLSVIGGLTDPGREPSRPAAVGDRCSIRQPPSWCHPVTPAFDPLERGVWRK